MKYLMIWLDADDKLTAVLDYPQTTSPVPGGTALILANVTDEEDAILRRSKGRASVAFDGTVAAVSADQTVAAEDRGWVRRTFRTASNTLELDAFPSTGQWPPPALQGIDPVVRDPSRGLRGAGGGPPSQPPRRRT